MTDPIYHLATPAEWAQAEATGLVEATVATEGFVHCSTAAQLVGTIERHFAGVDELRILELDTTEMGDELRVEESRPGEHYPHLYRPIATSEVRRALTWMRSRDGGVELPAEMKRGR